MYTSLKQMAMMNTVQNVAIVFMEVRMMAVSEIAMAKMIQLGGRLYKEA